MFGFKILFAIIFFIISDENVNQVFFADTCMRRVPIFILGLVHMNPGQRYVSGQAIVAGQKLSRLLNKRIMLFT